MAKQTHLNVNGTWKALKSVWRNVGGTWKKDCMVYRNVAGTNKECMSYLITVEVPTNTIIPFTGTVAEIPTGWYLCDGNNGTPDLSNKFMKSGSNVGESGNGVHTHDNVSSEGAHSHYSDYESSHKHYFQSGGDDSWKQGSAREADNSGLHRHTLYSSTHNHTVSSGTVQLPHYTLLFIMKGV